LDKNYWNNYYSKNNKPQKPSSFAKNVANIIPAKSKIMELGCGTGRDSNYFASKGHIVFACDQSEVIIENLLKSHLNNPYFLKSSVNQLSKKINDKFDIIYARFVLHALDDIESKEAIDWIFSNLKKNGLFLSESRSIKDSIFGNGDKVNDQRRFLKKNEILKDLKNRGFIIDDVVESKGLAIYKDSDPVVIRITARKP
jgi:tellurite methyltransferase